MNYIPSFIKIGSAIRKVIGGATQTHRQHGDYISLTNFMELNSSWEAASCADTQLPSILWNPKIYYHIQNSPPLVHILSHINPVHATPSYLRSILLLFTHRRLGLPRGLFPSDFPTNILYAFIYPHSCYTPFPSHPPWLDHSNCTYRRVHKPTFIFFRKSKMVQEQIMHMIASFIPSLSHWRLGADTLD
jgi:hypothetical protein